MTDNSRGALVMMASMLAFTLNDVCVKLVGSAVPLFQLLAMRGLLASVLIFLLAWRLGALRWRLDRGDAGLIALRSLAELGAAYFFLTALFNMPIANVTALLQLLPLTVTLCGALLFREHIGWRRMGAIAIGFAGMLLIVRPGTEGFNDWTLFALLAVVCVTVRDLAVRRMSRAVPSLMVTLAASVTVTLFSAALMTGAPVVRPDAVQTGLICLAAVLVVGGYTFSVMVMRMGELSFVTPFRYTGLLWALVLGWLVFGEWPVPLTLIGAAIIAGTGIFTLYREGQAGRGRRSARVR